MGQEQCVVMMPYMSTDLVSLIAEKQKISEEAAIKNFIFQNYMQYLKKKKPRFGSIAHICCTAYLNRKKKWRYSIS